MTLNNTINDEAEQEHRAVGIVDVLRQFGFDARFTAKTKMVRHTEFFDILELYQATQESPVFKGCDFVVSFTADGGGRAKFYGVYRVLNQRAQTSDDIPEDSPLSDRRNDEGRFFYDLESEKDYEHLKGKLVIDWGKSDLSWQQWLKNNSVIEILGIKIVISPGCSPSALGRFTDYLGFSLAYHELQELIANPNDYRDWQASLSAVAGVYLILAQTTGELYIGSAYGQSGIWGRWEEYATTGHGGNTLLMEMIESYSDYPEAFRYSVLHFLPKSTTPAEVIQWEQRYKEKLGTRAKGLNLN